MILKHGGRELDPGNLTTGELKLDILQMSEVDDGNLIVPTWVMSAEL